MLARAFAPRINSDDPAYLGGYENDNYRAVAEPLSREDLITWPATVSWGPSFPTRRSHARGGGRRLRGGFHAPQRWVAARPPEGSHTLAPTPLPPSGSDEFDLGVTTLKILKISLSAVYWLVVLVLLWGGYRGDQEIYRA